MEWLAGLGLENLFRGRQIYLKTYKTKIRPHIEYCYQVRPSGSKQEIGDSNLHPR